MRQADDLDEIHQDLLNDSDRQFDRPTDLPDPPEVTDRSGFIDFIGDVIAFIEPLLRILFWVGLALVAAAILFFVLREFVFVSFKRRQKKSDQSEHEDMETLRPAREAATHLLEDADRLAASERFGEAVHLLLYRSIEDLKGRRDRRVPDALTAREVGELPVLPDGPRRALKTIIACVETSYFGGLTVTRQAYETCRAAYEAFAFHEAWS